MRLTGLKRAENGLKHVQGPILPILLETAEGRLGVTRGIKRKNATKVRGRGGRGKAPILTRNDYEAGPSHRLTPSATLSSSPHEDWRSYLEPARRLVSLSSSPSYHHSFGPHQDEEPHDSHHSFIPLQRSGYHSSFQNPTPYFQSRFNPMNQVQEPEGPNPLGPADHFPEIRNMDVDEDPDPEMPPSGTPTPPIDISSGSSFHGSPYRGPDIWAERWASYKWEYTPPHRNSPPHQQIPSENPHFQAVTPPPPSALEQQLPPEPPRRRRGARMPPNPVTEVDSAPVAPALPPMGFENPIPSYPGAAGYNPFEQAAY
ncbi:leucine-rich repeat extensin-like protein 3 [Helianthus annuus]|uniref:leucine-rich repeat extensin-like protein 3 n=1 Tax=Helianthus annuus TaxID=4232 RepID=UPI000B8EED0B|nr:leucine-rich repeat extensin-like protein 3 [Helianthus annuus]